MHFHALPQDFTPTALVVDDEHINRMVLCALVQQMGYRVVEAANGAQAVEEFASTSPDIVFMDVMMPVMDGYEATRRIKELAGRHFVPVIVITALSDERALARCVESGGDDVLTKPFDEFALKSKIHAMMRIRALNEQVARLYHRMQRDEQIAEEVFSRVVMAGNVAMHKLPHLLKPAGTFSGDVLLSAYGPGRDLHVLLGDFTGHGLSAALGAVPTAQIFREMVAKGHSAPEILVRINSQLNRLLPLGMFMTAGYVQLSSDLRRARVFNFAMPAFFHLAATTRSIKRKIRSEYPPMGIEPTIPISELGETLTLDAGDSIVMFSDGVSEAINAQMHEFGVARIVGAIAESMSDGSVVDTIAARLTQFCEGVDQRDDISLVEVPCKSDVLPTWDSVLAQRNSTAQEEFHVDKGRSDSRDAAEFHVTVHGAHLANSDPVPLLLGNIREMLDDKIDYQVLYTILTELYVNAVDHGVLGLRSVDKKTEAGFVDYVKSRQEKLAALERGFVTISLLVKVCPDGVRVTVQLEDSGAGFEPDGQSAAVTNAEQLSHGLSLVASLCESLRIEPPGNKVEAVFFSKSAQTELA